MLGSTRQSYEMLLEVYIFSSMVSLELSTLHEDNVNDGI